MRFGTALYHSLFDGMWLYAERTNMRKAWSYFFVFTALVSVLSVVPALVALPAATQMAKQEITKNVPDFSATFMGGRLSVTGLAQPWVREYSDDGEKFRIVIDTTATSTDAASAYASSTVSMLVVNSRYAQVYNADAGESKTQSFSTVPNATFTKSQLLALVDHFTSPGAYVVLGLVVAIVVFVGAVIGNVWSVFIASLIALLVSRLSRRAWTLRELFTVGLYAITLPTLIGFVFTVVDFAGGTVYFAALVAFMLAVVFLQPKASSKTVE